MTIQQKQKAAEPSRQSAARETTKPARHADWISYAAAVTQQATPSFTQAAR